MKSVKLIGLVVVLLALLVAAGCGGGGSSAPPALVSITVTPASGSFAAGTTFRYTATGTYSNGTVLNLTSSASWTSSNPAVASISDASGSKGSVTTVAAGTTTISATFAGVTGSTTLPVTGSGPTADANVMTVTVNGALCSDATSAGYFNKPCVAVTVCNPGTSTCQTVNDILLDTGSFGLRIFKQAIPNLTLTPVASGAGSLAGCVRFADQSSLWGPIMTAGVQLAGEPQVQIPIQVIDSTFGTRPAGCSNADPTPVSAGFNGILGVGVFPQDCGPPCATDTNIGIYYRCTGASCTETTVPVINQVQNPVASLPQDNNGIQIQLPSVPIGGVSSITGSMTLGIATQGNNPAGSPTVFPTDPTGDFQTVFFGVNNNGFLDTGSNAYYIPNLAPSVLPPCPSPNDFWYCPPVTRSLLATNVGASGTPSADVNFNVSNALVLFASGNKVFSDVAGTSTFGFDWGLPFFMGRRVSFGIEGRLAPGLGTGPYVAY